MKKIRLLLAFSTLLTIPHAFCQKILTTIPLGGQALYSAVNPVTNMIYVPNSVLGTVTVINGQTDKIITNISLGGQCFGAAVNPNTNLIYVTGFDTSGYVAVIDGSSNTVVTTIPVLVATLIAVNPTTNRVYFETVEQVIDVLDGATNQIVDTITLTGVDCCVYDIKVNQVTNRIFISEDASSFLQGVVVIDGNTDNFVTWTIPNAFPEQMAIDSARNRLYVQDGVFAQTYVLSASTGDLITTILVGYFFPIALNPTNHEIATFSYSDQTGSVFLAFANGYTYNLVGKEVIFPKTTNPGPMVAGVGNRYYVAVKGGMAVISGP